MRVQIRYSLVGLVIFAFLLGAFQPAAAQYTNPYNGVSHSTQIAKFYDMTSTWNSNLWSAMNRVEATKNRLNSLARSNGGSGPRANWPAYGSARTAPATRQYPITATDFKPAGARIAPDQFAKSIPGLTREQMAALSTLANQFITGFESAARKNNVANAVATLLAMSLQTLTGREVSDAESRQMIAALNNTLAANPQFISMAPQDKQLMYETAIIMSGLIITAQTAGAQQNDSVMLSQARELSRGVLKNLLGVEVR